MTKDEMMTYDYLVENEIATAEEINLVRNILDGTWLEVLNAIVYARTGYKTLYQMIEAEQEDET